MISVTDGICRIHGLSDVMQGEMLEFPNNTFGLALNLERDSVGAVILGDYEHFALHHIGQSVNAANTVGHRNHGALIANVSAAGQPLNAALDQLRNLCGIELHDSFLFL